MKILKIILLVILTTNIFGDSIKDITNSSEIGYIKKDNGFYISNGKEKEVIANKFSFICINNKTYKCLGIIYDDNSIVEIRKKISTKKYIKFWKRIEQYNVWDLKTIDLRSIGINKDGVWDEELDPYKNDTAISNDEFTIFIKVKDKEHKCTTIGIDALKDSRYKQVVIEIDKFMGNIEDFDK